MEEGWESGKKERLKSEMKSELQPLPLQNKNVNNLLILAFLNDHSNSETCYIH